MSGAKKSRARPATVADRPAPARAKARPDRLSPVASDERLPEPFSDLTALEFGRRVEAAFRIAAREAVDEMLAAGVTVYGTDADGRCVAQSPDGKITVLSDDEVLALTGISAR